MLQLLLLQLYKSIVNAAVQLSISVPYIFPCFLSLFLHIPLTEKSNAQDLKSEAHLQDEYHDESCPLPGREPKKVHEKIST